MDARQDNREDDIHNSVSRKDHCQQKVEGVIRDTSKDQLLVKLVRAKREADLFRNMPQKVTLQEEVVTVACTDTGNYTHVPSMTIT